jgi:hypothetical protein
MEMKAATLFLGDLGPTLKTLWWKQGEWTTDEQEFSSDADAKKAFEALQLTGYLTADEGYLWVGQSPDMVAVSCDGGAGHIFLVLDEEDPEKSGVGFISNARWIVENGTGFLEVIARKYQETLGQYENRASIQ